MKKWACLIPDFNDSRLAGFSFHSQPWSNSGGNGMAALNIPANCWNVRIDPSASLMKHYP